MLPRWHIFLGAIFTTTIWILSPGISLLNLTILFLSSFLIDFDHYVSAVLKTKKYNLKEVFKYYDRKLLKENKEISGKIKGKGNDFHFFHTLEFHVLIAILSLFYPLFFYVFIGMVFHSLLDIISLTWGGNFHRREYFFFNWLRKKV